MLEIAHLKEDANFCLYEAVPEAVMKYVKQTDCNRTQYCSWITILDGEVVQRTFAFRKTVSRGLEIVEVERKSPAFEFAVRRNIYFTSYSGYCPVYEPKTHASGNWYGYNYYYFDATTDWNKWYSEKPMGICTKILNPGRIFDLDKYQYCGYSGADDLIEYLRKYDKNPKVEYFGKMGIKYSKTIENLVKKDKQFLKWLRVQDPKDINLYGPAGTIRAYVDGVSIEEGRRRDYWERVTKRDVYNLIPELKGTGIDPLKVNDYLERREWRSYNDYIRAVKYLGLDLKDTKNVFPNDFERMHEMRIAEYSAAVERAEAKKKRELNKRFKKVASQYKRYETTEEYAIVIPDDVKAIKKEGKELHHCVYKMGYDKKMADGKCIIAFVRMPGELDKPFVTVEYMLDKFKISQIYGDHDSRPPEEVRAFVYKWAEWLTNELKKEEKGEKRQTA